MTRGSYGFGSGGDFGDGYGAGFGSGGGYSFGDSYSYSDGYSNLDLRKDLADPIEILAQIMKHEQE